jgi:hypothetical protein
MSVIIPWDHVLTPRRLPSGDLIRLTATLTSPVDSNWVTFQLRTATRVTWLKRIRFFDARGELAFLQTEGSTHQTATARFSTHAFNTGGLRFELVKPMAFGVLTGVYEFTNVGQWKSHLLLFEWQED